MVKKDQTHKPEGSTIDIVQSEQRRKQTGKNEESRGPLGTITKQGFCQQGPRREEGGAEKVLHQIAAQNATNLAKCKPTDLRSGAHQPDKPKKSMMRGFITEFLKMEDKTVPESREEDGGSP